MREIEVGLTMVVESWIAAAIGVYLIVDSLFRGLVRRFLRRPDRVEKRQAGKSGSPGGPDGDTR